MFNSACTAACHAGQGHAFVLLLLRIAQMPRSCCGRANWLGIGAHAAHWTGVQLHFVLVVLLHK